jgi:RimJ/RimL family protein N-acetyltransferase
VCTVVASSGARKIRLSTTSDRRPLVAMLAQLVKMRGGSSVSHVATRPIGAYDLLIAGQARRRGARLVTVNVAEFGGMAHLDWEDWTGWTPLVELSLGVRLPTSSVTRARKLRSMHDQDGATDLRLRAFDQGRDLAPLVAFEADPESAGRGHAVIAPPQTPEQVVEWVKMANRGGFFWTIADAEGAPLGFALVSRVDRINRTLWTGTAIYEPGRRGRGLGTAGRRCVLSHVFYEMDYRRVYGEFAEFNVASWRSHQKLGAEQVGRRRGGCVVSGRTYDMVQYVYRREAFEGLVPPPERSWAVS